MSDKEIRLNGHEVISLMHKIDLLLIQHFTFRVDEFIARMRSALGSGEKWFDEGVDCEVLYPEGLWKEGKVRIRIEFCPNESESIDSLTSSENSDSELDDIRQILSQEK